MSQKPQPPAAIISPEQLDWEAHPRFPAIAMKPLITSATHPQASVSLVDVPPDGVIGRHIHPQEIEVVYVLAGQSLLTLDDADYPFSAGQIVAIPAGLEHGLRNVGDETVQLLTFFTPPII